LRHCVKSPKTPKMRRAAPPGRPKSRLRLWDSPGILSGPVQVIRWAALRSQNVL